MTASAPRVVIVLTTLPVSTDPVPFARALVEQRLAACVNLLPEMTSVYRWQGSIEQEPERQVVIKTTAERLAPLETRIRALHPYDVPELLVLEVTDGAASYLQWVGQSVAPE